jgi:hypothetical protein
MAALSTDAECAGARAPTRIEPCRRMLSNVGRWYGHVAELCIAGAMGLQRTLDRVALVRWLGSSPVASSSPENLRVTLRMSRLASPWRLREMALYQHCGPVGPGGIAADLPVVSTSGRGMSGF